MTELNKQWYEGTLEKDKYYYAKDSSEGDCIVHIDKSNELTFTGWEVPYKPNQSNILEPFKLRTELLAEVPSYDEWQDLKSKLQLKETAYDFDTARLEAENAQLKELLKECRRPVCWYVDIFKNKVELLNKINEVLK